MRRVCRTGRDPFLFSADFVVLDLLCTLGLWRVSAFALMGSPDSGFMASLVRHVPIDGGPARFLCALDAAPSDLLLPAHSCMSPIGVFPSEAIQIWIHNVSFCA